MRKGHKRVGSSKRPGTTLDLKVVENALDRLEEVEPGNAYATVRDPTARRRIKACREELRAFFIPLLPELERILSRELPEARITGPCGQCNGPAAVRSPLANFLMCDDLCGSCLEEARRSLTLMRSALLGDCKEEFLPPAVIAARITAAQAHEQRRDEQRRVAREQGPLVTFTDAGDGTVLVTRNQRRTDPGNAPSKDQISGLPTALAPYRSHLITWADLANYLTASGAQGIRKGVRALKSAAPRHVFARKSHRSLFRLGEAFLAAIGPAHVPERVRFQLTPALKRALLAPDHIPDWASGGGGRAR